MANIRGIIKILCLILWICPCLLVGYLLLHLSRRLLRIWVKFFWSGICSILGLTISIKGTPLSQDYTSQKCGQYRPVIFIANHISWLDIPVLGSIIYASFVAKKDMHSWPILGWACQLGQTLFVSRHRQTMINEIKTMDQRLDENFGNLVIFPEGTSSDGIHVLPFKSSFFYLAFHHLKKSYRKKDPYSQLLVQPVSLNYNGLDSLPVTYERKNIFAWYGTMTLVPHIWHFLQRDNAHVTVTFAPPLAPDTFKNRKQLADKCYETITQNTFSHSQTIY